MGKMTDVSKASPKGVPCSKSAQEKKTGSAPQVAGADAKVDFTPGGGTRGALYTLNKKPTLPQ